MTLEYLEHGPHRRRRTLLVVGFILLLLALTVEVEPSSDAATPIAPTAPLVTPGAETLKISWTAAEGPTPEESQVRSLPSGKTCVAEGLPECTVEGINDATPWTFSVREKVDGAWSAWSGYSKPVPHRQIIVIAGQSNATGWESAARDPSTGNNLLTQSATPADQAIRIAWDQPESTENVRVGFGDAGPVPLLTPQILKVGTWIGPQGSQIFGPEVSLARGLYAKGVTDAVILKVTQGGTRLGNNGVWNPSTGARYEDLVNDAHQLETIEASEGYSATIAVINWYQCESDALEGLGSSYQVNLTHFITSLRHDLGTNAATPFVIVKESLAAYLTTAELMGTCTPAECQAWRTNDAKVRAADDAVAASVPHVVVIDSLPLARVDVNLHLANTGELTLGSELAVADFDAGMT